eukprot:TRINITY_DN11165_c0_g2_i1.p1 TRINITY_DN11165_c0_g2~~TRINITY_DN11165_c0_g2_i1.p1  ORF type:complete len:359 (-),score=30.77 TRINITY_DN11165_c0_g2_i1:229-1266(-)
MLSVFKVALGFIVAEAITDSGVLEEENLTVASAACNAEASGHGDSTVLLQSLSAAAHGENLTSDWQFGAGNDFQYGWLGARHAKPADCVAAINKYRAMEGKSPLRSCGYKYEQVAKQCAKYDMETGIPHSSTSYGSPYHNDQTHTSQICPGGYWGFAGQNGGNERQAHSECTWEDQIKCHYDEKYEGRKSQSELGSKKCCIPCFGCSKGHLKNMLADHACVACGHYESGQKWGWAVNFCRHTGPPSPRPSPNWASPSPRPSPKWDSLGIDWSWASSPSPSSQPTPSAGSQKPSRNGCTCPAKYPTCRYDGWCYDSQRGYASSPKPIEEISRCGGQRGGSCKFSAR